MMTADVSKLLQLPTMRDALTISDIRLKNLNYLMHTAARKAEIGSRADFAKRIGVSAQSLNHYLNQNRNVGHRIARQVETHMHLPLGWMDNRRDQEWSTMGISLVFDGRYSNRTTISLTARLLAERIEALGIIDKITAYVDGIEAARMPSDGGSPSTADDDSFPTDDTPSRTKQ